MYEAPRVPADNPHYRGIRIREVRDLLPGAFSTDHLAHAYASLADSQLILESPTFDEVDSYFNPGIDIVSNDMVLEAITVDKFSRTEKRMAAMVRVLNRHLADSEITALDPVVGKPKKTGQFAFVTVQLPFSDGQTVSVIFHAPEGDRKKIGPSDTIIAFRWLLNKRDITQVVAPEDGVEISLETIAKRITQLVAKNTARFEKQQKGAQAERKELDATRQTVKDTSERQAALMGSVSSGQNDLDNTEATLAATLTALEKQKTLNAELEAKIDALKKARAEDAVGGGDAPSLSQMVNYDPSGSTDPDLKRPERQEEAFAAFLDGYNKTTNPYLLTSNMSDAFVLGRYFAQHGYERPRLVAKSRGDSWRVVMNSEESTALAEAVFNVEGEVVKPKSGPSPRTDDKTHSTGSLEKTIASLVSEVTAKGIVVSSPSEYMADVNAGRREGKSKSVISRDLKAHKQDLVGLKSGTVTARKILGAGGKKEMAEAWLLLAIDACYTALEDGTGFHCTTNMGNYASMLRDALNGKDISVLTGGNETPPQPAPAEPAPAFLSTLAEISAGKYDHEGTTRIGDRIDEIMDPMDDAIMKQYETELNAALDHLTVLLKEKAAKYL